jgi:hypothetical protein
MNGEMGTSLTINFEIVDSERDGKSVNRLIISPNPSNIIADLSFDTPVELMIIVIYDTHGRLVRTFKGEKTRQGEIYNLDVKSLQSGNYFIKTIDTKGRAHSGQMLIKKQ